MNRKPVDRCRREDIPAVAELHLKVYGDSKAESSANLQSYYETVLFDNPWYDEEIPSRVFRTKEGRIEGLMGVLTHRMVYNGRPSRMSTPHSFMVASDCSSPMAAMQLIREVFSGPQDLIVGDGANDPSRALMEAMGATTSYLYSMHWLFLTRPCTYTGNALRERRGLKLPATILQPASRFLDAMANRARRRIVRRQNKTKCTATEMNNRSLHSCITDSSANRLLYPVYSLAEIDWIWNYLASNTCRGRSCGFEVHNEKGHRIGSYLYYLRKNGMMQVVHLWARDDSIDLVFDHLLDHALACGATSVEGRLDPRFLQSISNHNCFIKRRSWTMVHAKDPGILEVLNRGDAMLSPLEGEFWVHSLSDELYP